MMTRIKLAARRDDGFTLLELLVAMFIAAIIFAMGYGAINQAVKSRTGLQEQQAKLMELQNAMRVMEQDFVQLSPRKIRQPIGTDFQGALISNPTGTTSSSSGFSSSSSSSSSSSTSSSSTSSSSTSTSSSSSQPLVALTRAGWTNPAGAQRPALQRVAYYFENGTLRREYWTVLDPTQTSATVKRDLMTHVKSVQLRFMDLSKTWQPQWPPVTNTQGVTALRSRPIAVEITLDTEDWGKIVRVFEIAV
jgi:general secretion pathway protein J